MASTGSAQTIFGYDAEQTDRNGLVYLRARYYAPYLNQFLQRDTIVPDPRTPMEWNRWAYAGDNPVNRTDPSGHCYIDSGNMRRWRIFEYPIAGPCTDHTDDVLSAIYPHWHEYNTDNVVCPAYLSCSEEEVADAMPRFDYPGQEPSEPIQDLHPYFVVPFKGTPFEVLGAIRAEVSEDHLTTANIALPTHIFYKGEVHRTAYQASGGDWHVSTHGFGNNIYFEMDTVNQKTGADIFTYSVDVPMRIYLTENHFKNWFQGLCSTVLIPRVR